jgi:pyruvate-formate lyase-activating enzyme
MNSARTAYHHAYYRPQGFSFDDVCDSIRVMKGHNRHVSLNYFILPGFTDDPDELEGLCSLIEDTGLDLIQLRNLNMDPEYYLQAIKFKASKPPLGIRPWLVQLKDRFPHLRFGYFNPFLQTQL